jgi:hypothetical protein
MKYTLLFFFLLLQVTAKGQNYSCIPPQHKTYFTNNRGYLRGMRIDSVRSDNGNTLYYPFRTARVKAQDIGASADTLGGSWIGRMIVESADGTTYIPNRWGDTVKIHNQAALGDSWILLQNASSIHYLATVTSLDTLTIGNALDSLKTIRLTTMDGSTVVGGDALNGLEIILSKHNGIWQAMDFYLFPYKDTLTQAYDRVIDYYLSESMHLYELFPAQDLTYKRVNYTIPSYKNIFDYEVGDVIITKTHDDPQIYEVHRTVWDSVTAKNLSGDTITYNMDSHYSGLRRTAGGPPGLESYSGYGPKTLQIIDELLVDTIRMPEEWYNPSFHYFREGDSSFCYRSNVHTWYNNFLADNGQLYVFEQSRNHSTYKEGLGMLSFSYDHFPTETRLSGYLIGARKNGQFCGENNQPLSVNEEQLSENRFKIYPNPASDKIRVITEQSQPFTVSVFNILGRATGIRSSSRGGEAEISISALPAGLYLIGIERKGNQVFRKILVRH